MSINEKRSEVDAVSQVICINCFLLSMKISVWGVKWWEIILTKFYDLVISTWRKKLIFFFNEMMMLILVCIGYHFIFYVSIALKHGNNDHVYNEFTFITMKLLRYFWSHKIKYNVNGHSYKTMVIMIMFSCSQEFVIKQFDPVSVRPSVRACSRFQMLE